MAKRIIRLLYRKVIDANAQKAWERHLFEDSYAPDLRNKARHQVAVNFLSEPLTWHDTIGNQLLVSVNGNSEDGAVLTELFSIPPYLSIHSLKEQ